MGMIEDDLRILLADEIEADVYSRYYPAGMPECVVVQEIGGRSSRAGIRRTYHLISIMGVSSDKETAGKIMRQARDALVRSLPFKTGNVHYYTAVPQADGSLLYKVPNGPKYVEYVDIEVGCSI